MTTSSSAAGRVPAALPYILGLGRGVRGHQPPLRLDLEMVWPDFAELPMDRAAWADQGTYGPT